MTGVVNLDRIPEGEMLNRSWDLSKPLAGLLALAKWKLNDTVVVRRAWDEWRVDGSSKRKSDRDVRVDSVGINENGEFSYVGTALSSDHAGETVFFVASDVQGSAKPPPTPLLGDTMIPAKYLSKIELADGAADGPLKIRLHILRTGQWTHPHAPNGVLDVTEDLLRELKTNFDGAVRGSELPSDVAHKSPEDLRKGGTSALDAEATPAWVTGLEYTPGNLYALMDVVNPEAAAKIRRQEIKYASSTLNFGWSNPEDGKQYNVLTGVALTNRPYIKNLKPAEVLNLSEMDLDDPDQENELPDQCIACDREDRDCPFDSDELKQAAAGDGNCPQYQAKGEGTDRQGKEFGMGQDEKQAVGLTEINAKLDEFSVQLTEARNELATVKSENTELKATVAKQTVQLTDSEEKEARATDATRIDRWVADGKLEPGLVPLAEKFFIVARGGEVKLSEAAPNPATVEEIFCALTDARNPYVEFDEGGTKEAARPGDAADRERRVIERADALQQERKCDRHEALRLAEDEIPRTAVRT